jgi:predicted deacylase
VTGRQDLNRSFPGDPDGDEAQQLADAIFSDIRLRKPDIVLDLHEAIVMSQSRDFLGSTYIFTDLAGMEDLFFDLLFATQDGTICHNEFGYTGPGPDGSVNAEVTKRLHIPVITVETFRGFDIVRRVQDQLDTIGFVLDYYGMR